LVILVNVLVVIFLGLKTGVTHSGRLSEKIIKHENSFKLLQNKTNLKVLKLTPVEIQRHYEKNR